VASFRFSRREESNLTIIIAFTLRVWGEAHAVTSPLAFLLPENTQETSRAMISARIRKPKMDASLLPPRSHK
jgi:hypothetical protein